MLGFFVEMVNDWLEILMDDFTPYGNEFYETLHNLEKVLECCIQTHLCFNTKKCHIMMTEGIVLGHYLYVSSIQVDLEKIEVILKILTPKTQKEVHHFMGHVGYYKLFIHFFFPKLLFHCLPC